MKERAASAAEVSNSAFLGELAQAAPLGSTLWITAFPGSPDLTDTRNWHGQPYNAALHAGAVDGWTATNTYFSVAALRPTADGQVRRRKVNFVRLLVLVVDDVQLEDVQGQVSYVLQTSPGKQQVGILLDHNDADCASIQLVDRLVTTMVERGLLRADASGNNAVRYVRLPVGQNQKPRDSGAFTHVLEQWSPNVRLSLADAAAAFGVDLDEVRASLTAQAVGSVAAGPQDELLRTMIAGVVRGEGIHDGLNKIAASLVASGMPGGSVVNLLRGLMDSSGAPRDERFAARYADIPRSVTTAQEKFARAPLGALEVSESGLPLVFAEGITADGVKIRQIVEDVLTEGGLSVMYGESNSGKSFLACDMSCAIASGLEWLGKRTVAGSVLYVAGEGSESIKLRVLAWRQKHNTTPSLAVVPVAVNLLDRRADLDRIIDAAARVTEHYELPVTLIVIDTLARAFGGGNENASEDMGAVITHADELRSRTGAHVMFVHHSGKDSAKGSRGHSSLKAATDTEIEVTADQPNKLHTAEVTKQRDLGSRGEKFIGKFRVVRMGTDQWGKPTTTCVVDSTDEKPVERKVMRGGGAISTAVVTTLSAAPLRSMRLKDLALALVEHGFSKTGVYNAVSRLVENGMVTQSGGIAHLNERAQGV